MSDNVTTTQNTTPGDKTGPHNVGPIDRQTNNSKNNKAVNDTTAHAISFDEMSRHTMQKLLLVSKQNKRRNST